MLLLMQDAAAVDGIAARVGKHPDRFRLATFGMNLQPVAPQPTETFTTLRRTFSVANSSEMHSLGF
jgi:hypothetical protein